MALTRVRMVLGFVVPIALSWGPAIAAGQPAGTSSAQSSSSESPRTVFDRAVDDFLAGRIADSVAGFDLVARLVPDRAPEFWQRGIALYYAGRYRDCRAQFEAHRLVNPDDVENAAWHFLCVARAESPENARAALLPVGPDSRSPMTQIYAMFQGTLAPETVLSAAGNAPSSAFFAHLYVGLYFEAVGDVRRAHEHIASAAAERFAAVGGYMHDVARVHLARRNGTK